MYNWIAVLWRHTAVSEDSDCGGGGGGGNNRQQQLSEEEIYISVYVMGTCP